VEFEDVCVVAVGGNYPEANEEVARKCGVALTVGSVDEMMGKVDAVMVTARDGKYHAGFARPFIEAGLPAFVDKPFTCNPKEAAALAELSAATGTVCTGSSTICFTKEVRQLQKQLPQQDHYEITYQADPYSPFGGWYFYGSHLTDLCVSVFGPDWQSVAATQEGAQITATVSYPDYTVTLRTAPKPQPYLLHADQVYQLDDRGCYDAGMAHFMAAAEGREESIIHSLVRSTQLMDAIITSLRAAQPYPV
jgi:predicted dehydrogenase